jgi:hypothetical protein
MRYDFIGHRCGHRATAQRPTAQSLTHKHRRAVISYIIAITGKFISEEEREKLESCRNNFLRELFLIADCAMFWSKSLFKLFLSPVTTHIQMKLVMEVLMATRRPSRHNRRWDMTSQPITLTVQPPTSREAPLSIRTLSVDIVSVTILWIFSSRIEGEMEWAVGIDGKFNAVLQLVWS